MAPEDRTECADRPECVVVGDPVAHSLSPVLHAAAYAAQGMAGRTYRAQRVPEGGLAAYVAGLGPQVRGLSVTAPLKREAHLLADEVDEPARRSGVVNTLVLGAGRRAGRLAGHNTDVPGATAALREVGVTPRELTVLGSGATATSLALAACDLGARRVRVLARDPARAAVTVAAVRGHPAGPQVDLDLLEVRAVSGDLVVSTIPVTAQAEELVAACVGVADCVFEALYDPWPTPLAAAAAATGARCVGGLDLLVHQAALQHELFTGRPAPLAVMREAGRDALASR